MEPFISMSMHVQVSVLQITHVVIVKKHGKSEWMSALEFAERDARYNIISEHEPLCSQAI